MCLRSSEEGAEAGAGEQVAEGGREGRGDGQGLGLLAGPEGVNGLYFRTMGATGGF